MKVGKMGIQQVVEKIKWIVRMRIAPSAPVPFRHNGSTYYVNPDKSAMYHIQNSTAKIQRLVECIDIAPKIVFDVGANCGLFAAFVERKFPGARIYCFEPSESLIPTIKRNCGPSVTVMPLAVSESDGETSLFVNLDSQQTNSIDRKAVECVGEVGRIVVHQVASRSIDSVVAQEEISRIDVLKVDVQGAERQVIKGAKKALGGVEKLLVESTWMDLEGLVSVLSLAREFGFSYLGVVNAVYLGADIVLSRTPLAKANGEVFIARYEISGDTIRQQ